MKLHAHTAPGGLSLFLDGEAAEALAFELRELAKTGQRQDLIVGRRTLKLAIREGRDWYAERAALPVPGVTMIDDTAAVEEM